MAAPRKNAKATSAKEDELLKQEATLNNEEITETSGQTTETETTEETTEAITSEPVNGETEGAEENPPEDPEDEGTNDEGTQDAPEKEQNEGLLDDVTETAAKELAETGKNLENAETVEQLEQELEKVNNIEKSLQEEIKKNTEKAKDRNYTTRVNERFAEFWCGVSDGWNN